MSFSIWWKDRQVKATFSLYDGERKGKKDAEGNPLNPSVDVPVVIHVDAPDSLDAQRIRRCFFAISLFTQQLQAATEAVQLQNLAMLERRGKELESAAQSARSASDRLAASSGDPDAIREAEEASEGLMDHFGGVDFFEIDAAAEYLRIESHVERHEPIVREAVRLICKHVRHIKHDVGESGVGNDLLFNGEQTWEQMTPDERVSAAMRMTDQFMRPLMEVLGRGAEAETLKK